jgi:GNAT superfamily N-acetyltransferase
MQIRRAQPAEAGTLSSIAQQAKAYWGYPAKWLREWRATLTVPPDFIAQHDTFVAEEGDRILAFYALVRQNTALRLEHLWVLPNEMNRGIGRQLFQHAAARATALGADCLTIEADPHAEGFYLHLGAIRSGAIASEIDGQPRKLPLLTFRLPTRGQNPSRANGRTD